MGLAPIRRTGTVDLVGRDGDLDPIRSLVRDAGPHGAALLLTGDPGVGKTALLDAAAQFAADRGMRVLRAGGAAFESDIPFSTLHQLLLPLRSEVESVDGSGSDVLRTIRGAGTEISAESLALGDAALSLLGCAAGWLGLLVVVDDVQWVDPQSALVLAFVARRLAGSRVSFLGATRSGATGPIHGARLPEHEVTPLTDEAARRLVDARFPSLPGRVTERVLAEAGGNPLALLELPTALATQVLPGRPPMTRRLQSVFGACLADVSEGTRWLLLLAALDSNGGLPVLNACATLGEGLDQLAEAERARLAFLDEMTQRIVFTHPLVRAAVVSASTVAERRDAHDQLAELYGQIADSHPAAIAEDLVRLPA